MNPAFDHLDDRLDDDPKGKKAVAAKHEKKRSLDENKSSDEKKSSDMGAYPVVDIHTHMYPMTYFITLLGRTSVPYIHRSLTGDYRLIILPSDDNPSVPVEKRGRPIDASYYDVKEKFKFMEMHGIATSVISLANPWLDFAEPQFAAMFALEVNDELERMCAISHARMSAVPLKKTCTLYAFGSLPLKASPAVVVAEIARLSKLKYTKGIIMGTTGLGNGLDDHALEPIWKALEEHQTLIFLHPHYGLPAEAYGGEVASERYGHVLHLALGFPLETTIAVTRMFLSGVFDRYPQLKVLLAHSGGTLPFLAGRIESCIAHERTFTLNGGQVQGPIRDIWSVLKRNIWLDAVIYGDVGLRAAMDAAGSSDRLLFGELRPILRYPF